MNSNVEICKNMSSCCQIRTLTEQENQQLFFSESFFPEKVINLKTFPDFEQKTLGLQAKNFQQGCQNCILCFQKKNLVKKLLLKKMTFWDFEEQFAVRKNVNMFTPTWQNTEKEIDILRE